MVRVQLKLARIGMNMESAMITRWLVQPGERFVSGQGIYEIETEKVSQEVEAPGDGTMLEIRCAAGDEANVGDVVCVVESA